MDAPARRIAHCLHVIARARNARVLQPADDCTDTTHCARRYRQAACLTRFRYECIHSSRRAWADEKLARRSRDAANCVANEQRARSVGRRVIRPGFIVEASELRTRFI